MSTIITMIDEGRTPESYTACFFSHFPSDNPPLLRPLQRPRNCLGDTKLRQSLMFRSSEVKSRNNAALQQSGPPGAPPVSLHNQPGGGAVVATPRPVSPKQKQNVHGCSGPADAARLQHISHWLELPGPNP